MNIGYVLNYTYVYYTPLHCFIFLVTLKHNKFAKYVPSKLTRIWKYKNPILIEKILIASNSIINMRLYPGQHHGQHHAACYSIELCVHWPPSFALVTWCSRGAVGGQVCRGNITYVLCVQRHNNKWYSKAERQTNK